MRILTVSIVMGPLMLVGVLPAIGQVNSAAQPTQSTSNGNSTPERDSYMRKERVEMREWRRKLHGLGETMKVKGQEADAVTDNDLNAAWTKTRAEEHKLRIATAEDWEFAKASFERADRELADAWDKARPMAR